MRRLRDGNVSTVPGQVQAAKIWPSRLTLSLSKCYKYGMRITFRKAKRMVIGTPLEPLARRVYSPAASWFYEHLDLSKDAKEHREIRAIIKRVLSENSNCIDVGASIGVILNSILKAAPKGTHYAFEPIPALYQDLVDSFPEVHVFPFAVSDKSGVATFHHVVSRPAYSGIRRRRYPSDNEVVRQIEVRQDTLDNVIGGGLPIHFIKIDVEGAELGVLKGAANTIRNNKPTILFEHELEAIEQYGTATDEIYDLLSSYGLHVSFMRGWLREEKPLSRKEFVENVERGANINFIAHP
jgi:FkbM family methyltransferase